MIITKWRIFLEKVGEIPISNPDNYISAMNKSMSDKLFFLDIVKPDVIVDFGCADGTVLLNIKRRCPKTTLIGYDLDPDMIQKAKNKVPTATITNDWNEIKSLVCNYDKPAILLSRVIHEVYSYSISSLVKKFWNQQVFGNSFKYIIIRDMIPTTSMQKEDILEFKEDAKKITKLSNKKYLNSFEKIWGLIDNDYRTLIHWLLKYTYTDNWEREVRENYVPITLETLKKKIPSNYRIVYEKGFVFPPIEQRVLQDYGVKIRHNTHIKMIIENTNL